MNPCYQLMYLVHYFKILEEFTAPNGVWETVSARHPNDARNKEYPNILIDFINSILKRPDPITSVELINTELDNTFIGEHGIRLDLIAKTSTGELLNVEMQKKNSDGLREQLVSTQGETNIYKRSLFYLAKIYYSQLTKGQEYKKLCPVIVINILDFNLFNDNRCNRNFVLKDEKTNEEYLRMIEMHFVELNKRKYMDQNDELWAWTEFLKAPNSSNLIGIENEVESIANAKEIFDKANADPIQKEKIRLLDKTQMDNLSAIANARDEGKQEEQKQIALNMLNQGLDNKFIAKCLNITTEELKKLINK